MIDTNKLAALRKRVEHFRVESSAQQISDLVFLLSVVDELLAAKQKAALLVKQIGESTHEETSDYRKVSSHLSQRVCTRTAFNAAREATA